MGAKRVVVVGQGGREHALALKLLESPSVAEVVVTPGNAGIAAAASSEVAAGKRLTQSPGDPVDVARHVGADLVVVGPEAPLCAGLVDRLQEQGIAAYGPTAQAARLEGSKVFMKDCASRWGIPTGRYRVVRAHSELDEALSAFAAAPVVKADGLCAGKGVVVASSYAEAREAASRMLSGQAFGDAGKSLVLEERLHGVEVSAHAVCDGDKGVLLPFIQDHKRLRDGDQGPNTGGMGTYGPVELSDPGLVEYIEQQVVAKVLAGMKALGCPFKGTLFANLMLVPGVGPMLLEINTRFGDPETQVLTRITGVDWFAMLSQAAAGNITLSRADVAPVAHGLCVVLAAPGYPDAPRFGAEILGLERAAALPGVQVFHAGTALRERRVVTSGGRVLGVTAVADSLSSAQGRAYAAVGAISFEGMQYRKDIAYQALGQERSGAREGRPA